MKYIIFNGTMPVIFPDDIHHKEVADGLKSDVPSSAGHMTVWNDGSKTRVDTHDAAETIGMVPNDNDCNLLEDFLNETE